MGTYNIYRVKKGKKRAEFVGSFDWYTHERPLKLAKEWLKKQREANPEYTYTVKNADGKEMFI